MVLLEVNGGAASSSTEVIVFGVLALAIVAIGLLLFRSLKKINVPYADEVRGQGRDVPGVAGTDPTPDDGVDGSPAGPEDSGADRS